MDSVNSTRKCLHCGDFLPANGRGDRKYCPEKFGIRNHCKNSAHNPVVLAKYHETKGLNKIHSQNKTILKNKLNNNLECFVAEEELINSGFKLEFIIQKVRMTTSQNIAFLYLDYGLEVTGNNRYKIFKHGKQF